MTKYKIFQRDADDYVTCCWSCIIIFIAISPILAIIGWFGLLCYLDKASGGNMCFRWEFWFPARNTENWLGGMTENDLDKYDLYEDWIADNNLRGGL